MSEDKNINNKKRNFILDGKVNEESVRKIVEKILEINEADEERESVVWGIERKPINIIVNSFGGHLYDANLLISVIETSKTPIHTYCYSKAMSAGFYIFSSGHKRFASPLATFMYHDSTIGLHDTIAGIEVDLEWQKKIRDQYDNYMLSRTNLPKYIMDEKKRLKEDWYLTAQEAYQYGLVDEIVSFRN